MTALVTPGRPGTAPGRGLLVSTNSLWLSLIPRGSGALLYCGFPTECGEAYLIPVGPTKSQNNKIWEPTPTGSRFAGFQISAPRALKSFTKGDPIPKRIPFPISFFERTLCLISTNEFPLQGNSQL